MNQSDRFHSVLGDIRIESMKLLGLAHLFENYRSPEAIPADEADRYYGLSLIIEKITYDLRSAGSELEKLNRSSVIPKQGETTFDSDKVRSNSE